jgi:hypothetical protein
MSHEKLSFTQLEQQRNSDVTPAVLVKRTNGTITTGIYEGLSQEHPGRYDVAVDNGNGGKTLSAEQLSDDYQAKLAEQLAGKPLREEMGEAAVHLATGFIDQIPEELRATPDNQYVNEVHEQPYDHVAALSEEINRLLAGFSEDDKGHLYRYSMYTTDKSDAQKQGNGQLSITYGQYIGEELKAMSPEAERVANRYHNLLNGLSAARKQAQ